MVGERNRIELQRAECGSDEIEAGEGFHRRAVPRCGRHKRYTTTGDWMQANERGAESSANWLRWALEELAGTVVVLAKRVPRCNREKRDKRQIGQKSGYGREA